MNAKHFWTEWVGMWNQINTYWTAWFSYVLVALGGVLTYWDQIDDYLPKKWRGGTYAVIGITVLLLRARGDMKQFGTKLRAGPPS